MTGNSDDLSTSESFVILKKAEIEAETQRYGHRQGVLKVFIGTCIVGVAAAFFPFAQKWSELQFTHSIETEKMKIQERSAWLRFLEEVGKEGRSEDIDSRIRLAEFYEHLSEDGAPWAKFKGYLDEKRKEMIEKRVAFASKCDLETTSAACVRLGLELNEIVRYARPSEVTTAQQSFCDFNAAVSPEKFIVRGDLLEGVLLCTTPNKGPSSIKPEIVVVGHTASNSIAATANWYLNENSRASIHILIGRDGEIIQMGRFTERLWHAGQSYWNGRTGLNNYAIGIELVNWGQLVDRGPNGFVSWAGSLVTTRDVFYSEGGEIWHQFTDRQMEVLQNLLIALRHEYKIESDNIVLKSEVTGGRRNSPGPALNWKRIKERLR